MKKVLLLLLAGISINAHAMKLSIRSEVARRFHIENGHIAPKGFYNDEPSLEAIELLDDKKEKSIMLGLATNSFGAETWLITMNRRKYIENTNFSLWGGLGITHGYVGHNTIVYNDRYYYIDVPLVNDEGYGLAIHGGIGYHFNEKVNLDFTIFGNCVILSLSGEVYDFNKEE